MADSSAVPDVFTSIRVQEVRCRRLTCELLRSQQSKSERHGLVQTLEMNYEYIKKIAECQKNGKLAEATALTTKLHQNLTALARAADAQLPADLNQACPS